MNPMRLTLPLLALAIAGCGTFNPFLDPGVTLTAKLNVADQAGRHVLAEIQPWTRSNIASVTVTLYRDLAVDEQVATQTLNSTQVQSTSTTITFNNLRRSTNYRIVATALSDAADPASRIEDAANSETLFSVGTNDQVTLPNGVKLTLVNRPFSGTAGPGGLNVVDGGLATPSASESISVN